MQEFCPVCYTSHDFLHLDAVNVLHKENQSSSIDSPIKNYHCLARAYFDYNADDDDAILRITADDYYKLYVNGEYVGEGPAPAFSGSLYYNEIDISTYLNEGRNVIAVHLYYQGLVNRMWVSGDNRLCLCAMLEGRDLIFRYSKSEAFSGVINGYDTDFTECFDGRLWDSGWNKIDFDDTKWALMPQKNYSYRFEKQPTKMLDVYRIKPEYIKKEQGRYFIDNGFEICGGLYIKCSGKSGEKIIIRYAEELCDDGSLRYDLRANCHYSEEWILTDGENELESYLYKGFRYAEIVSDNSSVQVEIICRHYPFDDDYCRPKFSDSRLDKIFNLCKSTIKYATQEGFIDCPTREKGQYLGDAFIAGHSHMLLTGDTELVEKCISQLAQTAEVCRGLMAVAPCSLMQEIADYSLLFGELVLMTYGFNGDRKFLEKHYKTARDIILHFKQYERADGLIACVSDKWNLVDWPENMRDGYDFELSRPITAGGVHNVINAYYIGAVGTLNKIENKLGLEASFDHNALKNSYINAFMREGLFTDGECSVHSSLHSNALALYYGLVPDEYVDGVADFIAEKGFSCGVFFSYFVMKALALAGRKKELYELLVNDSEHGWLNMLKEGATACFEVWGKNQKHNTSLCHPWATAPISIITEELKDYAVSENE